MRLPLLAHVGLHSLDRFDCLCRFNSNDVWAIKVFSFHCVEGAVLRFFFLPQNMLKILGVSDKVVWTSWYMFFTVYNLPTLVGVAFISQHFAFTLSDISFIISLLLVALVASIPFALFVTARFTAGNLAGNLLRTALRLAP